MARPRRSTRHRFAQAASLALAGLLAGAISAPTMGQQLRELAVCADPDNLPFSNDRLEGFENRIAGLLAKDLGATVRYTWSVQRRGFLRRTLNAGECDVVMGMPVGVPGVLATRPYYASSYVFVSTRERKLELRDFDAPVLRGLKIGLQAVGAEGANTPPASSLARRGLTDNVVGFAMWGEDGAEVQRGRIIEAVAKGQIDTAVVWGPLAGYYAKRYANRLVLQPIGPDPRLPNVPFAFDIALGVRSGDAALRAQLQEILDRRQQDIQAILKEYGVPLVTTTLRIASRAADETRGISQEIEQEH